MAGLHFEMERQNSVLVTLCLVGWGGGVGGVTHSAIQQGATKREVNTSQSLNLRHEFRRLLSLSLATMLAAVERKREREKERERERER